MYLPSPPGGYPVLNHDRVSGALAQVRWNNDDRSTMNHLDPYVVEDWCVWFIALYFSLLTSVH